MSAFDATISAWIQSLECGNMHLNLSRRRFFSPCASMHRCDTIATDLSNSMPVERLSVAPGKTALTAVNYSTRKPQRVTITVPYQVYAALLQESDYQGRSLSNLASVWLEQQTLKPPIGKGRPHDGGIGRPGVIGSERV